MSTETAEQPIDAALLATERVGDDPPAPEPAAEETVERDTTADTLEIPDSSAEGGKVQYVPISALAGARGEIKSLKAELDGAKVGSAKAAELEGQISQLQQQLQAAAPYVQAYQAYVQQQQQRPAEPQADPAEDAEAESFARNLDLWDANGKPDIGKAKAILGIVDKRAEAKSQATVAPLAQQTVQQQSHGYLRVALQTKGKDGSQPDPAILKQVWQTIDPSLTASKEGAIQAWSLAMGYTAAQRVATQQEAPAPGAVRGADGKFTKPAIPAPLHTEKAGGQDTPATAAMTDSERRTAKLLGMSEKEYMESAKSAPWLNRRGA